MTQNVGYSEVAAMGDVDKALGRLDEEARRRVLDWANSKYGSQASQRPAGSMTPGGPQPGSAPSSIKTFVTQKKPASKYELVACLAYYLEKVEAKTELATTDITKANTDARVSKMTNPALFVKHATHTYGYLSALGGRKFAISPRGEALVEALPDRDKVKAALE